MQKHLYRNSNKNKRVCLFKMSPQTCAPDSAKLRANLKRDTNYFLFHLQKKMSLYRDAFHKYISVTAIPAPAIVLPFGYF
jgi:hypothetical protein